MSQKRISIGVALNGIDIDGVEVRLRIMSLSLIAFQPAIEEPSNMNPSVS
jgi:hypothetical protein